MATGRIRVSLSASEVEVEGDLEFVERYESTLEEMLRRLREEKPLAAPPASVAPVTQAVPVLPKAPSELGEFGEVLQAFSTSASVTDQMLLAGFYAQASNEDNAFTTGEANQLLMTQGIKVGNPSQSMANNLKAKRVFKLPGNKYRVSKQGTEHLQKLGLN